MNVDEDALYRVLRALAREGVFEELDGRRFALTPLADALRGPLGAQARYLGRPHQWNVWSELLYSVRTGKPAFDRVFGQSRWEWNAEHPEESERFDDFMTAQSRAQNEAVVGGYDFGRVARIVDVGGGHGSLLRAILEANDGAAVTSTSRTADEYARLFEAAGLRFLGATPLAEGLAIYEAQGAATSPSR